MLARRQHYKLMKCQQSLCISAVSLWELRRGANSHQRHRRLPHPPNFAPHEATSDLPNSGTCLMSKQGGSTHHLEFRHLFCADNRADGLLAVGGSHETEMVVWLGRCRLSLPFRLWLWLGFRTAIVCVWWKVQ